MKIKNKIVLVWGILGIFHTFYAQFTQYNVSKEIHTQNKGVVVSAHPLASDAGAKMFDLGGNAFDAAIATQWALAVVYPQAGNIGGGGFMIATTAKGENIALDFRETAPQSAFRDMYVDESGKANTELSQYSPSSSGTPGSVAGLYETLKYAKLPMKVLIQPAIELAEKGFAIKKAEADLLNKHKDEFLKYNISPTVFTKNTEWKEGDILIQKDLAQTLKRIQKKGKKEFYEGKTAQLIIQEMKKNKGYISFLDLKNYQVRERKPLIFNYKEYEVMTMSLPSSGGALLAQMLKMTQLEKLEKYQPLSPQAVQIMAEAERRAYADRAEYMGDPDFVEDKTNYLISDEYIKSRWQSFSFDKSTPSAEVGNIINPNPETEQTTHISILDKEGNAVSVTTTLNGYYGSKTVVSGAGFLLNNEMDDFSIKPGVPNMFGAVGGEANAIASNKRMLSSMTPTIISKNKKPFFVVGTPGGTTIPTSVFQVITGVLDFNLPITLAVNMPRFHHQWLPEEVFVEEFFPQTTIDVLEKKNYKFQKRPNIGKIEAIFKDENGNIIAVADRRENDSVGVEK